MYTYGHTLALRDALPMWRAARGVRCTRRAVRAAHRPLRRGDPADPAAVDRGHGRLRGQVLPSEGCGPEPEAEAAGRAADLARRGRRTGDPAGGAAGRRLALELPPAADRDDGAIRHLPLRARNTVL